MRRLERFSEAESPAVGGGGVGVAIVRGAAGLDEEELPLALVRAGVPNGMQKCWAKAGIGRGL